MTDLHRLNHQMESQKLVFYWLYYGLLGRRQSWNVPVDSVVDWLVDGHHRFISWWFKHSCRSLTYGPIA